MAIPHYDKFLIRSSSAATLLSTADALAITLTLTLTPSVFDLGHCLLNAAEQPLGFPGSIFN